MRTEDIEEVLTHVYRMSIPLRGNPLKELNSYVIKGDREIPEGKNLLIDTGFCTEECHSAILEGLAFLGISLENTDILLTHLHADHAGNASELVVSGNKVYISEIDRNYLVGTNAENGMINLHHRRVERIRENGIPETLIEEMLEKTPSRTMAGNTSFTDYTDIHEGDELCYGAYTLKGIYTPGHTPGHMCFEIMGTGAMILGDHVLFDITPNITDWVGTPDALGNYLDSLERINQYDVTIPLPGHRKSGDFHGRIEKLLVHHKNRLQECENAIRNLGRAHLYDIAGNMTWKIRTDSWDTFPAAQRWFALGECLSHIDHLKKTGRIKEYFDGKYYWYEA